MSIRQNKESEKKREKPTKGKILIKKYEKNFKKISEGVESESSMGKWQYMGTPRTDTYPYPYDVHTPPPA